MAAPKVFFVHLRRPGLDDPRTDPFYEFGSFGCTKCHSKNLLHPRHAEELKGARLAFIQGGDRGSRLVFLTPPIKVTVWTNSKTGERFCEVRRTPAEMPFKYAAAPVLAANDGSSDFPLIEQFARETNCPTVESGLSSRFRSQTHPLPVEMAKQVISVYERQRREKSRSAIASAYYEALPYITQQVDRNRESTYRRLARELHAGTDGAESALLAEVVTPETHAPPRCGLSRRRQPERRTRRCT